MGEVKQFDDHCTAEVVHVRALDQPAALTLSGCARERHFSDDTKQVTAVRVVLQRYDGEPQSLVTEARTTDAMGNVVWIEFYSAQGPVARLWPGDVARYGLLLEYSKVTTDVEVQRLILMSALREDGHSRYVWVPPVVSPLVLPFTPPIDLS